jgi:hypothetical protein
MGKSRSVFFALGIVSLFLLLTTAVNAASEIRPGVLVDPAEGLAFVMHPKGGMDAVQVASGVSKWHSDLADKPVAWADGRLSAHSDSNRPGVLDLVVVDAENGSLLSRQTLKLPDNVNARIDDGLGSSFKLDARTVGDPVTIAWGHSYRLIQGIKKDDPNPIQRSNGGLRLDLAAGALTELDPAMVPKKAAAGAIEAEFLNAVAGRQFRSIEGNFVLASEAVAGSASRSHDWTIYDRAGDYLGMTRMNVSYLPFTVVDGVLLLVSNPYQSRTSEGLVEDVATQLRGIDLSSGKQIWAFEIRDTVYRGPFPP